jgi:hypothetical protein
MCRNLLSSETSCRLVLQIGAYSSREYAASVVRVQKLTARWVNCYTLCSYLASYKCHFWAPASSVGLCADAITALLGARLNVPSWRCRQLVCTSRGYLFTRPHSAISQKDQMFIYNNSVLVPYHLAFKNTKIEKQLLGDRLRLIFQVTGVDWSTCFLFPTFVWRYVW